VDDNEKKPKLRFELSEEELKALYEKLKAEFSLEDLKAFDVDEKDIIPFSSLIESQIGGGPGRFLDNNGLSEAEGSYAFFVDPELRDGRGGRASGPRSASGVVGHGAACACNCCMATM
jgi:hypothetical protein